MRSLGCHFDVWVLKGGGELSILLWKFTHSLVLSYLF